MAAELSALSCILQNSNDYVRICSTITKLRTLVEPLRKLTLASEDLLAFDETIQGLSRVQTITFPREDSHQVRELREEVVLLKGTFAELRDAKFGRIGRARFPVVENHRCYIDEVLVTFTPNKKGNGKVELCFKSADHELALNRASVELYLKNSVRAVLNLFREWNVSAPTSLDYYNTQFEFSDLEALYDGPSASLAASIALISRMSSIACNPKHVFTGQVQIDGQLKDVTFKQMKCQQAIAEGFETIFAPHTIAENGQQISIECRKILSEKRTLREVIDQAFATSGFEQSGINRIISSLGHPSAPFMQADYESGHFSKPDTIHIHVDGKQSEAQVGALVRRLKDEGLDSTIRTILDKSDGPQRADDPETYEGHTPTLDGKEELDYFSTHLLGNLAETKRQIRHLLRNLEDTKGLVIEAERIIGKIGDDTEETHWSNTSVDEYPALVSGDVGYIRRKSKPIEVHYSCDIKREGQWLINAPFKADELRDITTELQIRVGGWFLFSKPGKWAYRSNMFVAELHQWDIEEQRRRLKRELSEIGKRMGFECNVRALVEHTVGLWKTPLQPFAQPSSIDELAEWERKYPALTDFWVVTPNFLGDKDESVREAMLWNLARGVKIYVLHSVVR